jgi:autotransporter-associated beta strand protein
MTHACAIGYDWFYTYWTQARRDTIRTAIINKGLNAGSTEYANATWWTLATSNNWNCVCNGGLSLGALAVGTESEALTEDILTRAMNSLRPVMSHFTTDDGAWFEGPGYWAYATEYNSRMMAGLEWVLGSDFGLSKTRALSESGYYAMAGTGPFGQQFNFADSGTGRMTEDTLQWQARRFNQPLVGWYENTYGSGVLDALWWNDRPNSPSTAGLPPDFAFHGDAGTGYNPQEIVTLRGNWSDTRATFAGAQAGLVGESHGDLDQGCFVLDALGKRWFTELGSDDYALPGYFTTTPNPSGDDRWDYYRTRGEGQNTLIVNPGSGPDMVLGAFAPLLAYQSEPGGQRSMAIYDLTPAHSGMTRVWRGFQLLGDRKQMLVQDEIVASTGKTVWWFAHYTYPTTTVTIEAGATSVMLTQGAERLWCKIVSGGGTFQIKDATPLPSSPIPSQGQNTNTGYKKLAINLTGVTNTTLAVWMVPLEAGEIAPTTLPTITPLSSWNLAGSDAPTSNDGGATGIADNSVDIDLRNYSSDDATPTDQLRFSLGAAANGTVTLLADGHTARFTPTAGYTGVPSFDFTVTDTTPDSRMLLAYDFDLPDAASTTIASDVTGNFRDGTIDYAGAGVFALVNDKPAQLGGQGTRSIDLTEDGTNAVRVQRLVTTSELNFNTQDWTVAGWFKRRDTTNDDFVWHISNGDGFGSNDELYVNCPAGATTVRLQHYSAAAVGFDVDIPMTGITAGTWHHFAVVRSGTTLNFYVDGALAGSDSAFALVLDQTYPVIFGGHAVPTFQPGRWFDGQLDDCAVFTAALSSTEVGTLAGGMTVRHFGGLSATGTITLSATPTTSVWTATTSGAWSTGANWSSATAPASSRGATLEFFTGQTLGTGTVTANNDLGAFSLNVLTLAGTTSAAANAAIAGGALTLTNNGALNPVVNLNATNGAGFTYDVSNALTLAVATTFQGSGSATFRFNGNLSGVGALTKSGTSTLILTGTNSYAGGTTISAGTLQIGNNAATGTLAAGAVTDNGTLRFHRSDTALVVANAISGTGALQFGVSTGGTLAAITTLSGTNSFTGGVTVFSGAARITNSSALGTGTKTITLTNGSAGNPNLRLDGSGGNIVLPSTISFTTSNNNTTNGAILNELGNNTINGPISLYSGGGDTKIVVVAGTLTLAGAIAPTTTSRSLILGGAGTGTVNGAISDGTGSNVLVGLRKDDAGTWTLTGPVTHTGTVTVNAGTLAVNSSVSGPSSFTVASAAKLSGTGSIATNTTISGTHQPGAGLGTQTFTGTLTYGSASRLSWELGGNTDTGAGTNFDRVAAAGVTVTSGGKVDLVFNSNGSTVNFTNAFWTQNRTWTVLTASSISGTFTLGTISADSAGNSFTSFGTFSLQQTATAVNVLWTPAPSPGFAESGTSGGGTLVVTTGNGTTSSNTDGTASGATHAFAASAGNYAGLLTTTQPPLEYVGLARFAVNSRGHFSGTIWFESAPLPVRGKFSADGNYSGLIRRGQRALLALTLRLPEAQTDGLFGTLSDGVASTAITAQRTAFDPASNACPQAGSYQVELAGAEGDVPQATGEVLVRPNGSVSFRGLLADGTAVSQGTWLSRDGAWPFYRPLYAHRGYIAGPQVFEELGTSQLDGLLDWVAPPRLTAGGFRTRLSLTGQTIEIAPRTKRR